MIITDDLIKKFAKQEERMWQNYKDSRIQKLNGLLVFSGLVIAALASHSNYSARWIIFAWLVEASIIVIVFLIDYSGYKSEIDMHFEETPSDEQEKVFEKKRQWIKCVEGIIFILFVILLGLTAWYFIFH